MGQKKNSSASRSFLVDTLVKNNVRLRLKVASLERESVASDHADMAA